MFWIARSNALQVRMRKLTAIRLLNCRAPISLSTQSNGLVDAYIFETERKRNLHAHIV